VVGEVEEGDEVQLLPKRKRARQHDRMRPQVAGSVEHGAREDLGVRGQHGLDRSPLLEELLPRLRDAPLQVAPRQQLRPLLVGP